MEVELMANKAIANPSNNDKNMNALIQMINDAAKEAANKVIEQYKTENPDVDVDAILAEYKGSLPTIYSLQTQELDKFVTYAKKQGTKIPFASMEMGVLAAGRKDMQKGLAEILNSLKFDKPICNECDEEMDNRGRSKKKS